MSTMPKPFIHKACCTLPPVVSSYTPRGATVRVGQDMNCYAVGRADATRAIVIIYDIFGLHPATKQTADLLAQGLDARVVMPDLFLGKPWPLSNFPPKNPADLAKFFEVSGAWDVVHPRLVATLDYLAKHHPSITSVGLLGFCWGGKIMTRALNELADRVKAGASAHPYLVTAEDIEATQRPVALLPSKDEGDMTAVEAKIAEKWGDKGLFKAFDDMHHGWCAARADFDSKLNRDRTHEAVEDLVAFFDKNL
ncbi:hypothetical protein GGF32_008874 [Allomyces javanicus]|nr:hypothetical protein GGF32_008874 [Allomyces javanicus]